MNIQRAGIEDVEAIYHIATGAFGSSPWPIKIFQHELSCIRNQYFVAKINHTIVGFIGMTTILDEAEITSLAVLPDYQKQGIAQALIARVLSVPDLKRILLEVSEHNGAAQGLYIKNSFTVYNRRRHYYKNGDDALLMERKIL